MQKTQQFVLHAKDPGRRTVLQNLIAFLQRLPDDKPWRVEVKRHAKKRSDGQNRYLWGAVYPAFCAALEGWDAEDVHEYLLGECFGWERLTGLSRDRLRPIRRSSKLSTIEFAEYCDFCARKGAEHGIYIPEPDTVSHSAQWEKA